METTTTYPTTATYPITDSRLFKRAQEYVIVASLDLMRQHGLLKEGWTFALNDNRSRCGVCRYDSKSIEISNFMIRSRPFADVKDVILHEIAHVLAAKKGDYGHGALWRRVAISIGCTGDRCGSMDVPAKYIGTCPSCSRTRGSNRRTKRVACGSCCRRFNNGKWHSHFILNWSVNTQGL